MPPVYPWRTIADAECDANSPIKEQLIEALYGNVLSMGEGDPVSQGAGAFMLDGAAIADNELTGTKLRAGNWEGPNRHDPFITSKIQDGTFGTAEIKRSSQTLTGIEPAINTGSNLLFNAASHYMLGYETWVSGTAGNKQYHFKIGINQLNLINDATFPAAGTYVATFKYFSDGLGTTNINVTLYYINASPPYDLGDGEIQGFIYALVDSGGDVQGISISPDPPWYKPPPSSALLLKNGIQHVRRRIWPKPMGEARENPEDWEIFLDAMRNPQYEDLEITPEFKNQGMEQFPHPFKKPAGSRVVLIDPAGRMAEDIINLKAAGDDPAEMIAKKDILIGDNIPGMKSPLGVDAVRGSWR